MEWMKTDRQKFRKTGLVMLVAALLLVPGSVFLGRFPTPYITGLSDLMMAASGMVFQMIFRNPIVDAGFLGVSGGAAFGASLGIVLLGGSVAAIQGSAALFAVLGLGFSWIMAVRIRFGDWILRLILAGIAVSALFAAGTGLLKYLADPLRELPELTFWLLGGLWGITWTDTLQILAVCIPCLIVIWLFRWRLNLLSMQDETIFSLVADASKERIVLLLTAVIATSAVAVRSCWEGFFCCCATTPPARFCPGKFLWAFSPLLSGPGCF